MTPTPAAAPDFRLGQVALTVQDMPASIAFYRDALLLPFLFDAGPSLAFFRIGTTRLMLSTGQAGEATGSGTALYLAVPDIDVTFEALRARGVTFIDAPHLVAPMPDHDLWMCFFRDPDTHLWALMCEKPKR